MTDNFNTLKEYIKLQTNYNPTVHPNRTMTLEEAFDLDTDKYYVVELIRRGKDNPNLPAANIHFKNYYINKVSDLDKYKDEIVKLCDMFNMRAYFSVNYKSYEQVLKDTTAECARRVAVGEFKKPYNVYESCSGKYCDSGNKTWIIDVDKEDAECYGTTIENLTIAYTATVENVCRPYRKHILTVPTRSGCHIICHPFDLKAFNDRLISMNMEPHSDKGHQIIKKNHVTLLYENI